ncbi:hypothetical protein KR093_008818 [Drosophila rubida]|uniref:Uncharacterized protein n=1 Tax=Drosophila rubida TaxID=30044 RepID=A0AAD4K3R5_9MUSC|nr:hypothetical protein KR093_008818 [Drosophila rubida]
MEYAKLKLCFLLCAFALLCAAEEQSKQGAVESSAPLADLAVAGETSQADAAADGVEGSRKTRQYFGPPPPPFFGPPPPPPPPPYYGGGFGGFGGGYGGYGFGGGYQRTRVVTRTRYRGGFGGFGGGYYG